MFYAQFLGKLICLQERSRVRNRSRLKFGVELLQIQGQILDSAFAKFDVPVADTLGHNRRVATCHREHLVRHINTNNHAFRADNLRGDKADLSRATAKIENRLAFPKISTRVAASVVAL